MMQKNFAMTFTISGIIIIISMFVNIISCVDSQLNNHSNDIHVISAFNG